MNLSRMKSDRTLRGVAALAVLMAVLVILSVFNVLGVMDNRTEKASAQMLLAQSEQRLAQLQEMKANEEENRALVESYQALLPESVSPDTLLALVSSYADQGGVTVSSVAFQSVEAGDNGTRQPFTVTASGSYENVMRFLENVSLDGQLILVDAMDMSAQRSELGGVQVTARFSAYYQ